MKSLKKVVAIMLILAVLLPNVLTVSASKTTSSFAQSRNLQIIDVLYDIEPQKEAWGLANVDFAKLKIGTPIQTYNYVNGTLKSDRVMYPLTVDNRLVLWAIPVGEQFQITNGLVSEINATIDFDASFALIYDASNVYTYSNDSLLLLKHFNQEVKSRGIVDTNTRLAVQEIDKVSLSQNTSLGYERNMQAMQRTTQTNYSCNVSYVTQHPYNNLCWAASVACIVNYVNGTSLNAATVAKKFHGNTNFNQPIGPDDLWVKIQSYDLPYYFYTTDAEDFENLIFRSICADHPVGGTFDVIVSGHHSTVIFGINIIAGRIQVMDPEFGNTTATYSSSDVYTYVSSYANTTLELYSISFDTGD